ncbi:MAG TPA: prepilin-type N-terminal cleavage/methylation domain-containing protein [Verrucomicrobiota bacterium]|nr:prepilin-type N-terminal cleavage/methylation domain-containing protein [Verrucomicrobiota bacterium]HNU50954.1 prepilin-type N-terminal cleavage/methylation domain-containing protein [Verrucomicrobiota bacterium]
MNAGGRDRGRGAFTLLEVLLAVTIFGMVIVAVYTSWNSILRASKVGNDAATDLQRSRIASRTLEDALVSAVLYSAHPQLYAFQAVRDGDYAGLSFVARLAPTFPGSGYFGDQVVRRVEFTIEEVEGGERALVLRQMPLLQTNVVAEETHRIILAREVATFMLEFAAAKGVSYEWTEDWRSTNQLPRMVRFALAFGRTDVAGKPKDLVVRTVSIPSIAVPREFQYGGAARPVGVPPVTPGMGPAAGGAASGGSFSERYGSPVRPRGGTP